MIDVTTTPRGGPQALDILQTLKAQPGGDELLQAIRAAIAAEQDGSGRILSKAEAARMLGGISTRTLDRIVATKRGLKRVSLSGKRVGFRYSDLVAWMESQKAA